MMIDSHVCIDTGNSGTKIVYSSPGSDEVNSLFMSSAIDEIEPERLEYHLEHSNMIGFPQPEQQAWMKLDSSLIVVGKLAEKFSPPDRRKTPKYRNALYKILATIGVIIETHFVHIKRRRVNIQLGLLLPWNEYKDSQRLLGELKEMSSGYEFRGRTIRFAIKNFICYPEGGGIAMARVKSEGLNWFKKERIGVLMLGDRNWTGLYFESGQIQKGASPLEGFSFLLDQIVEFAPCLLTREVLGRAIFKAIAEANKGEYEYSGYPWSELEAIQSLSAASRAKFRRSEIHDIDRAITLAAKNWSVKLKNFIAEMFPQKLTEVNVCGGALPFFKPLIENQFNCNVSDSAQDCFPIDIAKTHTKVLANGGITKTVTEVLKFKSMASIELAFSARFADIFSLIEYMKAEEKTLAKQTK